MGKQAISYAIAASVHSYNIIYVPYVPYIYGWGCGCLQGSLVTVRCLSLRVWLVVCATKSSLCCVRVHVVTDAANMACVTTVTFSYNPATLDL